MKSKTAKKLGAFVVVLFFLGAFSYQVTEYQLTPIAGTIITEFGLTPTQFSSAFTASMVPAIALSIVFGLVADKFGMYWSVGIMMFLGAVGGIGHIFSHNFGTLFTTIMLTGFGACALNVVCTKAFSANLRPEKVSIGMGFFLAASTSGQLFAQATTAMFSNYRNAFWISGILTFAALVLWMLFFRDQKVELTESGDRNIERAPSIGETVKVVVRSKQTWFAGIGIMMCLATHVAANTFLPSALAENGMDSVRAGIVTSLISAGNLCGCIFAPIIAARLGHTKPLMVLSAVICTIGFAFAWHLVGVPLYIAFVIVGFFDSALMPFFFMAPIESKNVGPRYAGTATGLISTLELLAAVIIPSYVITPIATTTAGAVNYNLYFILAGICDLICLVMCFLLSDMGTKAKSKAI